LHHVFGIVMTQHASRMAIQRPFDLESKLLEGPSVATSRTLDPCIARSPEFRPHQLNFACPRILL
jgi:hypothetical protein